MEWVFDTLSLEQLASLLADLDPRFIGRAVAPLVEDHTIAPQHADSFSQRQFPFRYQIEQSGYHHSINRLI